jgi:hypothetical protein
MPDVSEVQRMLATVQAQMAAGPEKNVTAEWAALARKAKIDFIASKSKLQRAKEEHGLAAGLTEWVEASLCSEGDRRVRQRTA